MKATLLRCHSPCSNRALSKSILHSRTRDFRWGQSSVELAVTPALPWDPEGLLSITSDCCTQGTQVQFCLLHDLLLIGKSKPLSPFFVAQFSRGEQSFPWVEVWSWAPRRVWSLPRCSALQPLPLLDHGDKSSSCCPSSTETCPAHGAGWQGQCWGAHGLSQKDTSSLLCCLYKESSFRATSRSVGCCHCDTSSLLPGRRQNTGDKR